MNYARRLDVGDDALGADRIEIALNKFAVATALRVLAPPDGGNLIPFEWRAKLLSVLRGEPRQRHCQVEPHPDIAAAMILEAIELFVGLVAPFSS